MGYWSLFTTTGFIGWVFLAPEDLRGPAIEMGWRLIRSAWGQGFATEAAGPVLDHALRTLGLKQIIADIDAANAGSIGVARKLGFFADRFRTARGLGHDPLYNRGSMTELPFALPPFGLVSLPGGHLVPAVIAAAGDQAAWRFTDFFYGQYPES